MEHSETDVDKNEAFFFNKAKEKQAIITDLLLRDVRYGQTFVIKTWRSRVPPPTVICSRSFKWREDEWQLSLFLGCVGEVSVSYYEDGTDALLFSPVFVRIPRSCLSSLLSVLLLVLCTFCLPVAFLSISFSQLVFFPRLKKMVDTAINEVQFKGGKINSGTLGLSFGVLQGHPLCNVLRN